jgi:predicted NAD/FAD-dependent oxidoreductase
MIFDVAIIGAGLSGLSAARHLTEQSLRVVIVEKSHGVSGRAATRRTQLPDGTGLVIDHGAQFFTARDPLFQSQVLAWLSQEICFQWATGFHTWDGNSLHPPDPKWEEPRYACHGGMSYMGNHLASGLEIFKSFTVSEVSSERGDWMLHSDKANMEPVRAKSLFCSAPVPQSLRLVGSYLSALEREQLGKLTYGPCLAVMACYEKLPVEVEWKGIQIRDTHSPLSWIACDSSRRGPDQPQGTLVIHASPDFSSIEKLSSQGEKEKATAQILRETARILGDWAGRPFHTITHHWHYSIPLSEGLPEGFLRSENETPLYLIGDGLKRGRVEGAWLSGLEGAKHYVDSLQMDR